MKPHDELNSADIADHARKSMYLEELDYTDYKPHPAKRGPDGAFVFLMMALVVVLVSLAVAVIVAQLVMSAGGW